MKLKAYAKINLCLDVVGKRSDGYHELDMIMVPIDLYDVVHVEINDHDVYTCDDASLEMDASNTVVKAVELMRATYGLEEHFKVHIEKNIPAQAGLAGGSSDGAAVLLAIRELCKIDVSIEELATLSKKVGADVPFCVRSTCAVVQGIGELITPFKNNCPFEILLVKPQVGVSTQKAFQTLDFTSCDHPKSELVKACLEENRFEDLAKYMLNSLEASAFQLVPEIKALKQELLNYGFDVVLMSGSGSSVFALTRNKDLVHEVANKMKTKDYFVCETIIVER